MGSHHTEPEPWVVHRVRALESLLIEKGLLSTEVVDKVVQTYEKDVGPMNGAKVVARAWVDPAYKQRLLGDGTAAIAELGFTGRGGGDRWWFYENTGASTTWSSARSAPATRGCARAPPVWYKALRSLARRPRAAQGAGRFGVDLPRTTENPRVGFERRDPLQVLPLSQRHRGPLGQPSSPRS